MLIQTNKGIVYPLNPEVHITKTNKKTNLPCFICCPHASWDIIHRELDCTFSEISDSDPDYVFVLAPLHKGKIGRDDSLRIYTYSDCPLENELLEKDDEVCSEEYSYEILQYHIQACFPNAKAIALFAPEDSEKLDGFTKYLISSYRKSVFIISNNKETDCAKMWINALEKNQVKF